MPELDTYMGGGTGYYSADVIKSSRYVSSLIDGKEWDGTLLSGGTDNRYRVPEAYLVGIYWDGHLVEEVLIEEEGLHDDLLRETE